jgi:hypothetical protein
MIIKKEQAELSGSLQLQSDLVRDNKRPSTNSKDVNTQKKEK